jgi:hypothetical protein
LRKAEPEPRWVVVDTGNFQYSYVGKTTLYDEELDHIMDSGGVLELAEVRSLRSVGLPTMQGTILQRVSIIPIAWHRGPVAKMKVVPAALWIPDPEDPLFKTLMEETEKAEIANRAKDVGIEPAGPGDMPGGDRPS